MALNLQLQHTSIYTNLISTLEMSSFSAASKPHTWFYHENS